MISSMTRSASRVLLLNGSSRVNGNTAKLLKEIKRGVESVGGEAKMINLGDLKYKGCISCLQCKKEKAVEKCVLNDDLKKVWDEIEKADSIAVGFPIYMWSPNSNFMNFYERLIYPSFSYRDLKQHYNGKKKVEVVATMGAPKELYEKVIKNSVMRVAEGMKEKFGDVEMLVAPLSPISLNKKYITGQGTKEEQKQLFDSFFPKYLKQAFEAGKRLGQ